MDKFTPLDVLKPVIRMGKICEYEQSTGKYETKGYYPIEEGTIEGVSADGSLVKFQPRRSWWWPFPGAYWLCAESVRLVDTTSVPPAKKEPPCWRI
jgi:hypothetical protein